MMLLSLPSPSWSGFEIGPLTIHAYALCILTGIMIAWWLGGRRFERRFGGLDKAGEKFENITAVAVVCGIIGARLYHVITDAQLYFGPGKNPVDAVKIWNGGLGIWGAVALGAVGAWAMARRYGVDFGRYADVLAPTLLIAQAIGRVGNWFNQELFGRPTTRPWGLEIDQAHRPEGYEQFATFHPTFLYELLWNLGGAALLLWVDKRFRLGPGRLFALYVVVYCTGRLWIEHLRIDKVNTVGGFRLNEYTSVIVLALGLLAFVLLGRRRTDEQAAPEAAKDEAAEGADKA